MWGTGGGLICDLYDELHIPLQNLGQEGRLLLSLTCCFLFRQCDVFRRQLLHAGLRDSSNSHVHGCR